MSDYIKRSDALIILKTLNGECIRITGRSSRKILDAITRVKNLPGADAHERKKGEWLCERLFDWETANIPGVMVYASPKCSICGETSLEQTNYCPNCGADMRGEG